MLCSALVRVRRTASWSSRDAFTDGHLAEERDTLRPGARTKAATSRAHAFRKFHASAQRSSSDSQQAVDVRAPSFWGGLGLTEPLNPRI